MQGRIYVAPPNQHLLIEDRNVKLWSAVRALEEQVALAKRIVDRARKSNQNRAARTFERRAREAEEHSSVIRQLLLSGKKDDIADEVLQGGDD